MIQFLDASVSTAGSLISMVLPMVIFLGLMYLILWLPQKKQDKKGRKNTKRNN